MKNTEIKAIIDDVFGGIGHVIVNATQHGNGYFVSMIRRYDDAGRGYPEYSMIGYGVRVYGIEGAARIRAKLSEYAARA